MLPFEDAVKADVATKFKGELSLADRALAAALEAVGSGKGRDGGCEFHPKPAPGVEERTGLLTMALFAKSCNQFRAIRFLCASGLRSDASILGRSLFEGALALSFLLEPNVRLTIKGNRPFCPDPSKPLTIGFRTELYLAHHAFRALREWEDFLEVPALAPVVSHLGDEAEIRRVARDAENQIGTLWANCLRSTNSYSGVSIKWLAHSLGAGTQAHYAAVYGRQSRAVHAADAVDFLEFHDDNRVGLGLGPSSENIGPLLNLATALFLGGVAVLSQGHGLDMEKRIRQLSTELAPSQGGSDA